MPDVPVVTIVSGLPRSGTSVMMQMLHAGGLPALTDGHRAADEDNPRGYYELEAVKQIRADKSWLSDAIGKVVKLVHLLLPELPGGFEYRVIFMRRDLDEVLASQRKMLQRSGRAGGQLPEAQMKAVFARQVQTVLEWLARQPNARCIEVDYRELVESPGVIAARVNAFLGGGLDEAKMASAVDPSLYRNRGASRA